MKNFRKVLALILVVATLFSFVAMASAKTADEYADYADVNYVQAVDVLTAIGINEGYDGAFHPADPIDRDEVAAMIARLRYGTSFNADLYVGADNVFADVKGQCPILFLPELAKSGNANYSNKTPEPTIEMVSICYLYDMLVWPLFCHSGTYAKFRAPHTKFVKNSDVEFLPYWEKNHGISASNPNIKISVYRKKGELLAAVVNLSANSENTKVVIPGKYSSVKDAVSGEKISLDNINVPAKSLRLLLLNE